MSGWEPDDRFDDEAREQRELDFQHDCAMRDIAQGIPSWPTEEDSDDE